ncbi:hypothetical protein ACVXG7_26875 [Enterobacter hormaechei]
MLEFNKPEQVKHIALLEALNKKGDFSYFGRKMNPPEFYNGDCAITTASSGSLQTSVTTPNSITAWA